MCILLILLNPVVKCILWTILLLFLLYDMFLCATHRVRLMYEMAYINKIGSTTYTACMFNS